MLEPSNMFREKIRVLSFQSREVLDILVKYGEYHNSHELSREGRDYSIEKEDYGFKDVIWCFSPIGWAIPVRDPHRYISTPGKFSAKDFLDGSKFERFKCEMSLPDSSYINNLVLIELEYDIDEPKPGLTHNACGFAYVVSRLNMDNLVATYQLNYDGEREYGWYYPEVKVLKHYKDSPLFRKDFLCEKNN